MADEDTSEMEDIRAPIIHGMINTADLMEQDAAPNIETQSAETLALPEVNICNKLQLKK